MSKKNGKPRVKWPLNVLPTVPAFQRNGTIPGAKTGKPPMGMSGKKYNTYKAPPKRGDFIKPPVPPTPPPIPKIYVTRKTADSVAFLVNECPIELGWVGAVQQVNPLKYIIHDIRVMEQEATGATFEYDNWNEAVSEMIVKRSMTAGMVDANLGHSHVTMGVSPSGTDEDQMVDLAHLDENDKPTAKFSIQTIYNKRGEVHCSVYDWENELYYDKCPVIVMSCLTTEDIDDLRMQLKRVKEKTYSYIPYDYSGGVYGGVMYGSYNRGGKVVDPEQQEFFANDADTAINGVNRTPDGDIMVDIGNGETAEMDNDDYIASMEEWDVTAWEDWQDGKPVPDIQREWLKRERNAVK